MSSNGVNSFGPGEPSEVIEAPGFKSLPQKTPVVAPEPAGYDKAETGNDATVRIDKDGKEELAAEKDAFVTVAQVIERFLEVEGNDEEHGDHLALLETCCQASAWQYTGEERSDDTMWTELHRLEELPLNEFFGVFLVQQTLADEVEKGSIVASVKEFLSWSVEEGYLSPLAAPGMLQDCEQAGLDLIRADQAEEMLYFLCEDNEQQLATSEYDARADGYFYIAEINGGRLKLGEFALNYSDGHETLEGEVGKWWHLDLPKQLTALLRPGDQLCLWLQRHDDRWVAVQSGHVYPNGDGDEAVALMGAFAEAGKPTVKA